MGVGEMQVCLRGGDHKGDAHIHAGLVVHKPRRVGGETNQVPLSIYLRKKIIHLKLEGTSQNLKLCRPQFYAELILM